jgi:predicted ATPase/class 3 adenylate cyclase/Tfp pilus assembly protein PilF
MPESIEQPANLRALLLTDVVGSTQVAYTLGDAAMARHWAAHDRAARDLLPVWRGLEIDKTDGLLLQFECVDDAAAYALAYHRALAELGLPFKARAGLHYGSVTLRANGAADIAQGAKPFEVEGLATPVTARVMALALAGQTLMTQDAQQALTGSTLQVQSHGHWRLKGLPEPVELFEVGDEASPFTPPPDEAKAYRVVRQGEFWQPVREVHNTVPAERDSFVGRHETLLTLARKFESGARLVSVLGMGGTGKTRLATRFAWTWLGEFPGGVYFCDLAPARSADAIHLAIAQGLGLRLDKTDPALQIALALAGRERCLVILDNFEQVTRHAEATVGDLLNRAPLTRFIVTTREVLGIVGEDVLALAPLPRPDACALFLQRADSARQGIVFGDADQAAIQQLVTTLDGLPLAIELAAARVRVMNPRTLLARMNERFKLLWSSAGRHDRQATLRAAFDWSWEMLSPAEMCALGQLSVFAGSFTLASAETVLDLSADASAPWAVDVVGWLVDKSFLRQLADDRFDMLECVREYVAEHLRTEGRYAGSGARAALCAQQSHWRYFAGLDEGAATANRCIETTNLVAACRNATAHGDAAAAVALLTLAWAALRLTGPFRLGAELAASVRAMPGLAAGQLADVEWVAGSALELLGEGPRASGHFEQGLALARAAGHRHSEVRLLLSFASQQTAQGRLDEARSQLACAGALVDGLDQPSLQCQVLFALGHLSDLQARFDQACLHYQAALVIARAIGDRRLEGGLLGNLGGLHHEHGRLDEACRHYELALALARQVGDRRWEGNARCNLGLALHEQGHNGPARQEFEKALAMALEMGHVRLQCTVQCNLGMVLEAQPDFSLAEVHYANAVRLGHELGDGRLAGQSLGYLGLLRARLGQFGSAREDFAAGERLLREASDEVSLALLLCGRCEAELLAGELAAARNWWQQTLAASGPTPPSATSELGRALRRVQTLLEPAPAG